MRPSPPAPPPGGKVKETIPAYYADGEDAYAMKLTFGKTKEGHDEAKVVDADAVKAVEALSVSN